MMWSHYGYVMTLANSIIGVGILAMPFCFQKCGILLAIVLLIVSNAITRLSCHYLIKTSLLTRRRSFEFLGFHAFGPSGKLLVELCIIGYLLGTCITYYVVVGDLGPQIIDKLFRLPGSTNSKHLRTFVMCCVTLLFILPMGMLRNVNSLATVCTASIGFYLCLVLKIFLQSESHILSNDWPSKVLYWQPNGILQCLPILSMALSCQMQLFEVFTTINNQSLEKLNGIVSSATGICTIVYIAVGFFGYIAYCSETFSGNILINLSPSFSSDVIKIGFVLSVAFSFPLVIFPCRASIYSLLYRKGQTDGSGYIPETKFKLITAFIVFFSLGVALIIPSVELIMGLVGSTIGVVICIVYPAACFRKIVQKHSTERQIAHFIIIAGFILMILGTYANLHAIDTQSSGSKRDETFQENLELPKVLSGEDRFGGPIALENIEPKLYEDKMKNGEEHKEENAILPPLPVDEEHLNVKLPKPSFSEVEKPAAKLNLVPSLPIKKLKILPEIKDNLKYDVTQKIPLPPSIPLPLQNAVNKQLHLDKEAIKKEEKVAKEEVTNSVQEQIKIDDRIALQQTKKELEETKDFLEKSVKELKAELVKQNQETQHLVVEKLGEVVEKFQQFERQKAALDVEQKKDLPVDESKIRKSFPKSENKAEIKMNLREDQGKLPSDKEIKMEQQNMVVVPPSNMELIKKNLEKGVPLPLVFNRNGSQSQQYQPTLQPSPQHYLSRKEELANETLNASVNISSAKAIFPQNVKKIDENPPEKLQFEVKNEV